MVNADDAAIFAACGHRTGQMRTEESGTAKDDCRISAHRIALCNVA